MGLTVEELIEELKRFDPQAKVGYDWRVKGDFQEICSVTENEDGDIILES